MAKNSVKIIVLFAALISVVLTGCSDSYQTDLSQSQTRSRWHNSQGVVYMDQHNYTAGRSQFEKALALDSLFPTAHANLGIALYSLGKFDSARAELVACLALNPKHLHANYT
ncbi:MAG: tetratricopeptide repeat protein, partial [Candidatus Marinimicrobia bacterium]|nr:tetratricopeptide repeat protein [Candidatus Neomarinimicrobiota bacterium]